MPSLRCALPRSSLAALLLLTNWPTEARAQLFADDFESGTLLTTDAPAGKWDNSVGATNFTFGPATAAAHRGTYGFQVVDGSSASGNGPAIDHTLATTTGNFYARFWYRRESSNGLGEAILAQLDNSVTGKTVLDWVEQVASGQHQTAGEEDVAGYVLDAPQTGFAVGTWHLVELSVLGVGTGSGTRHLAVDGTVLSASAPASLSNQSLNSAELGEPYSDVGSFQGTLDFDDYRLDQVPHASHFGLSAAASASVNACAPVTVSLLDTFNGALAAAPYTFTASLASVGVTGGFFSDSQCQNPTGTVDFASGATTATVYFQATASGTASLTVTHVDFLDGSTSLTVTPSGSPSQLAWGTPARIYTAGACAAASQAVTVQLEDALGSLVVAPTGGLAFTAASTSGAGTFYSDVTCQSAAAGGGFLIPAGASSVTLYHRDTQAGTPSFSLTNGAGLTNPAPQAETVVAGTAQSFAFSGLPSSLSPNVDASFTLTAMDAFGNVADGYAGTVHFSSTDPNAKLPADHLMTAAEAGIHVFTPGVTFQTVGTQEITAQDLSTPTISGVASLQVQSGGLPYSNPSAYRVGCSCRQGLGHSGWLEALALFGALRLLLRTKRSWV